MERTEVKSFETAGLEPARTLPMDVPTVREPGLKRLLDLVLSTVMLILSAPVFVLVAVAIKLEDGGPIFYTQKRWGRGGCHILVRKFRTMVPRADKTYGNVQAEEDDERITRVGALLRATGLDELPQILSIWKGEMSFVGPRALAVDEIVRDEDGNRVRYQAIPGFWKRLSVRPGLTSIATIYMPKDAHPRKKFLCDLLYIRKQSFWLDVKLIVLSFWISFRGKWESRDGKV